MTVAVVDVDWDGPAAPYVVIMILHVTAMTQGCFTSGYGRVPDVSLLLRGFRGSHQPPA